MGRRFGRAARGQRVIDSIPNGHWKTTTFVEALRVTGLTAPFVLDGPMDGDAFVSYVEYVLLPTLKPGDIVVLDNLSSHKRAEVKNLVAEAQAELLFLPPYSPDLNPIENLFAKFKQLLRSASKRTIDELWNFIGSILNRFSSEECTNYFHNAGYSKC